MSLHHLFLPEDEDVPDDVTARHVLIEVRRLERRLEPAFQFYVRASAVLGAIRWVGAGTLLLIFVAVMSFLMR